MDINSNAITFSFCSSGGAGGQNVNRRSTKAVLRVWVDYLGLNPDMLAKLKILRPPTKEGTLVIQSDVHRTQRDNKRECLARLSNILQSIAIEVKPRISTRPTNNANERRINDKKQHSQRKRERSWRE